VRRHKDAFSLRVLPDEGARIRRAAAKSGLTVMDFLRQSAARACGEVEVGWSPAMAVGPGRPPSEVYAGDRK
jgi:hypothetical protein